MKINCINFSFSAHLYHMQTAATSPGMNWGWNTETLLTNLNVFKHRQVILTRQTTSHSSLALSGTDWESASVGLRKRNLEESDLGYSVKKVPKERGIYSFWSHTSMNQDLHPWWQRTTCWFQLLPLTISSYTWFCQVSQLLVWIMKFTAIPAPSPLCFSISQTPGLFSKEPEASHIRRAHLSHCSRLPCIDAKQSTT